MMNYDNSKWRHFFWRLPPLFQNSGTSIYALHLNAQVYGKYYRKHYKFIERSQWFSAEELKHYQNDQTVRFLRYAVETVPYYRLMFEQLGLSSEDIRTVEDLQIFPLLDKEKVQANARHLIAEPFKNKRSQIVNVHTSGTTGKSLHLIISKEAFQRDYAFRDLHLSWAGIFPRMKMAFFAGHPVTPPDRLSPPFWAVDKWNNAIYYSSQHITQKTLPIYISSLKRFMPDLVRGYPSSVHLVALGILDHGEKDIRPKAVFTNSETLLDYQRSIIEKAFSCKVYNWYGNAEQVANIVECEEGNLHVKSEYSFIEFLRPDGSSVVQGEDGEMVCTGFGNYAMPLIRYRVGDIGGPTDRKCPCSRGGPVVEKIVGRVEDLVVTPDGRHVGRLDHLFKDMLSIREAQLIQYTVDVLKIRIVKRPEFGLADMHLLKEEARFRLGTSIRLEFEFVDTLERDPSGKSRFVISHVPTSIR